MIKSWSHSSLMNFEKCKFLAYLKHDQRIAEPSRPLKPGQTELANDRGTRIHQAAEDFVSWKINAQIPELRKFAAEFDHLRHLYKLGMVSLEGEWAVDRDWEVTDWATGWHRSKVDAIVHPSKYEAIVIDYKSGQKFNNEVKHAEQTQLYALNAVLRFPDIEEVTTELWYVDQDELTRATFSRAQILRFKANFDRRGNAMTSCTEFPTNANHHTCKWCMYGNREGMTGHCQDGVWK